MGSDPKNPNPTGTKNIMALRGGVKENATIWDDVANGVVGSKKNKPKSSNFNLGILKG